MIDKLLAFHADEGEKNRSFAKEMSKMAIGNSFEDKSKLYEIIHTLADSNKRTVQNIADPVGRSCSTVQHQKGKARILRGR